MGEGTGPKEARGVNGDARQEREKEGNRRDGWVA